MPRDPESDAIPSPESDSDASIPGASPPGSGEPQHDPERLAGRLTDLEILYTHLHHDYEQLNATVLTQNELIHTLRLAVQRLEDRLHEATDDRTTDLSSERPPHY